MVYNKAANSVICIGVAIGPVGLTHNLGRLFSNLMENTSLVPGFKYRPIKMPLTHYFTSATIRGQQCISRSLIIAKRGHYHSAHIALKWISL